MSYGITIEGIRQSALYAAQKGVRFALEYKLKEPRTHSYLARAARMKLHKIQNYLGRS